MATEIVDFTLKNWKKDSQKYSHLSFPKKLGPSQTQTPVNFQATAQAVQGAQAQASQENIQLPIELLNRYGADALSILKFSKINPNGKSPEGFPNLEAQLRYCMRSEMVLHLEDFYLRRVPLYASRQDHGLPWLDKLAAVWAEERGLNSAQQQEEIARCKAEVERRSEWKKNLSI
jgi:glycerol-3-phosphate dehydrogenase